MSYSNVTVNANHIIMKFRFANNATNSLKKLFLLNEILFFTCSEADSMGEMTEVDYYRSRWIISYIITTHTLELLSLCIIWGLNLQHEIMFR